MTDKPAAGQFSLGYVFPRKMGGRGLFIQSAVPCFFWVYCLCFLLVLWHFQEQYINSNIQAQSGLKFLFSPSHMNFCSSWIKLSVSQPIMTPASSFKNVPMWGLPWWRSGWESACQCRGRGFEPWSGRIPHAVEQLGPWATTTEPARLEPALCNKRGRDSERPAHRDEEWPPLATTRESPRTETKTQYSQKLKK